MNILGSQYKKKIIFMLVALAGLQVSCGFHLRGVHGLADHITPVFVDVNGTDDELRRELKNALSASGNNALAISGEQAKTILSIYAVQKKQRVVAIDSRGRAREYSLSYQFRYELKKASVADNKTEIIKTNTVKLKRDLLFDPNNVLAFDHEKALMYEDMRKDAAHVVLRQLSAIKSPALQQE